MIDEQKYFNRMLFRKSASYPLDWTWCLFTQLKNDYRQCRLLVKSPEFEAMKATDRATARALYMYTKELLIRFYKDYRVLLKIDRVKRHAKIKPIPHC